MFCTRPDGQLSIPPIFDHKDELWWSYVSLPLFVPYFQVVCANAPGGEREHTQTLFLQSVQQLRIIMIDTNVDVIAVQLVSPGYMNGKGIWQIDILKSVYRGVELFNDRHEQYAHVYNVVGGGRYLESSIAKTESDLHDLELIIDLSPIIDSMDQLRQE